jgi:hypothetical protein
MRSNASVQWPQHWMSVSDLLRGYRIVDEEGDGFGNDKLPLPFGGTGLYGECAGGVISRMTRADLRVCELSEKHSLDRLVSRSMRES